MEEKVRERQAQFELREWTLGQVLDHTVARFPDNEALVYPDRNYRQTWSEFGALVDDFAKGLMALGVQKGEKVAVWATNVPYWVALQFATAKIGAILITVNTNYREHELRYLLTHSECENIFLIDSVRDHDYLDTLYRIAPELRLQSRDRFVCKSLPHLKRVCFLGAEKHRGMYSVPEILALSVMVDEAEYAARQALLQPWDVINMQYTSGTTGFPRGVMLTHVGVGLNGYWIGRHQNFGPEDRVCLPVPLFHCFGCVLGVSAAVNHGATMVILESFNALKVLAALDSERCTAVYGVPTMFLAELEHPLFKRFDLSHMRTGIMAGSVCPEPLMRRVVDDMNMTEITICYGLTEASPVMTQSDIHDPLSLRCETVGCAMPGIEVRVGDPDTCEELPRGEVGEILCRGYNVMKGYYNMPDDTAKAISPEGWLHSGDLGVMDENGYLRVTGRIKDMIIRGGENIYPREVEEFLMGMPGILDVQVVAVPSRKYGEEVAAFIIPRPGVEILPEDVRDFCRGKVSWYKIPKYIKTITGFPLTASGKIQKFKLREMAAEFWPEPMQR
ncbi:3-[(3aS,4S,7aS)-7a-methyl-1,5-dioxo-octahydro-1H-inden-4-yl]propanoyl:CoA ligase [bioreactor metagenome]|jgi:Acyl-CoA synthetases (AMP-forming)/AMP-acid ligases II|uniref:3-[(3aS,4S,7aS)-7a-methyl-1, 5-dioxo-octahydro-1H-inden-4-yl]propanoyl:CoA ligase n=2 Tax=root TaxID=1 RepID=A0A644T024_9ZZZZ|nr:MULTISPECIES: AMP-binding protein [Desulfovibrio]MBD8895820.1 AMP-binding protein [Desulfovibrio desulfuricans]MCB6542532.1 AMP-binding protein [Desulfovibrio desulfuricans]MCB6553494.1 AMP-binding protein [Desulfovibrio desulfuricans]MCB6565536.1 AMP-binding protein [Desulfovibrio desulfuricans]MCB7346503.1 AMP-binding protein [Desulfovibrio desulfuricans]